ncbi:hypothetical protein AQJ91_17970 [Streptomyces dysideae]|uniref:Uncharacterized protein n=1 Tax=Streptomyces dysideae TaxID=909626 RepID=A0A101UZH8_9ACTN|nr:hypothetical protein AQJ91_17970 [Streptomyces dysideae]
MSAPKTPSSASRGVCPRRSTAPCWETTELMLLRPPEPMPGVTTIGMLSPSMPPSTELRRSLPGQAVGAPGRPLWSVALRARPQSSGAL